jgi:PQQ-dependent catabolism-associated beta-propeller protein
MTPKRPALRLFVAIATLATFGNTLAATQRIFVTNEKGNSVSVLNGKTLKVEETLEIGKRPRGIGRSPDGKEIYVALSEEDRIAVIDPGTLKVLRSFPAGKDPETFAVHPNGRLYLSNEDDAKATVIDPKTGQVVAEISVGLEPEGVAISPDGKHVVVTSESANMLHVIGVPAHTVESNILVGARPRAAVFAADNKTLYASCEIGGEIRRIDITTRKVLRQLSLTDDKAKPKDVLLGKDGKKLYVAGGRADSIFVLDSQTLAIQKRIPVGKRVWGLALSGDGARLYTTDGASNQISVIDTAAEKVTATVPVGALPWGIVVDD